jgi:hypothetical protein
MNSKKNIIIVSARRSGTHLLTDLIVNNFGYESIDYNYIDYTKFTGKPKYPTSELDTLESHMNEGKKITWSHLHDYKDYHKYTHSIEEKCRLDKLFLESKIILVYRDVRDIINSCYLRPRTQNKYSSFSDFYNNFDMDGYELIDQNYDNMFDLLIQYYKNWFSVYMSKELLDLDMEIISFEEMIDEYDKSVNKIGTFLNISHDKIKDVRLTPPNKKNKDIIYTVNDFGNGKVGNWVDVLGKDFGEKLGKKYYTDLGAGLDCFIRDIKIHKYHISPERDKFQLGFKNWKLVQEKVDIELKYYKNVFKSFEDNNNIDKLIENRYDTSQEFSTDFRYYHKVFYYDEYVLKFIYPCKATLDKDIFNYTIPIASKEVLLAILKTDTFLYENGIVPKLYYAGIYNGIVIIVQEQLPKETVLHDKYQFHPKWGDWNWVIELGLYSKILKHFNTALENNILLTDIFNVYNCAEDMNGDLKYLDLDGIEYYETKEEMITSEDYKSCMGIINEVNMCYTKSQTDV